MNTLLISDVHLAPDRPEATARFCQLLDQATATTEALYLLGDVFDMWLGDDISLPLHREAIAAIRRLTDAGVQAFCLYGNHDFTMGRQFARATGCRMLREPVVTTLYGETAVLLHGDSLCTDDISYQRYRSVIRSPLFRKWAVKMPAAWRRKLASTLKSTAGEMSTQKPQNITDVQEQAVIDCLWEHDCQLLIHGHTHRAAIHQHRLPNGESATRVVLGDWFERGEYAVASPAGIALQRGLASHASD